MVTETECELSDGRTLHVYEAVPGDAGAGLAVFWHHGTPNTGAPPEPLFPAAARNGIRWVSYDRPGYGTSTARPGRDVASAAADVAAIADALGIGRFAVMGSSGGGPHALACAALLPDRVLSVVSMSGLAPFGADGLDWFAGMAPVSVAELRAATEGHAALEHELVSGPEYEPSPFIPADEEALAGAWSWLAGVAGDAIKAGFGGMIDDDLAYVAPWGFDPARVTAPVLLMHGGEDRMVPVAHARWLAGRCPTAELRVFPGEGHISVHNFAESAVDWLAGHASSAA
jgi:pimeloyl-ACP methyl ester carboxylesterase